jgi:predicted membrane-bound spermidine synthase
MTNTKILKRSNSFAALLLGMLYGGAVIQNAMKATVAPAFVPNELLLGTFGGNKSLDF